MVSDPLERIWREKEVKKMLEKRRMLLLLIVVSVFTLASGVIYAWVSTVTSGPTATHSGGSLSFCSGSAQHSYSYGNCSSVSWSYFAMLSHNGINIDADSDYGTHSGGGTFYKYSTVGGGATAVYSNHSADSLYTSSIQNQDNPNESSNDAKDAHLPRNTD